MERLWKWVEKIHESANVNAGEHVHLHLPSSKSTRSPAFMTPPLNNDVSHSVWVAPVGFDKKLKKKKHPENLVKLSAMLKMLRFKVHF